MRKAAVLSLIFGIVLLIAWPMSIARAEEKVMVIGDSWPAGYADNLQTQFSTHGHSTWKVANWAVPGSTADAWASDVAGVLSNTILYLNLNPSINYVVVSLGGNDLHGGFPFDQIEEDLRTVVRRLSNETYWLLGIVLPGYDILDWDRSQDCLLLGAALFGSVLPGVINPLYLEVGARQQIVAGEFPKATYLNLWGTGQGTPGSPNIYAFSPTSYVGDDCIHLTETGYNKFTQEIYCQYFAPTAFGQTCSTGPVCSVVPGAVTGKVALDGSAVGNGIVFLFLAPIATAIFWKRRLRRKG
jgi:lysophospholipase L1-like esterase